MPNSLRSVYAFKLVEDRMGHSLESLARFHGANPDKETLREFRAELRSTEEDNQELLVMMSRAVGTLR